ncbi:hypothetical protein BC567DRAFT_43104 [Phyllosticta citribraziliensis]
MNSFNSYSTLLHVQFPPSPLRHLVFHRYSSALISRPSLFRYWHLRSATARSAAEASQHPHIVHVPLPQLTSIAEKFGPRQLVATCVAFKVTDGLASTSTPAKVEEKRTFEPNLVADGVDPNRAKGLHFEEQLVDEHFFDSPRQHCVVSITHLLLK